MNYTDYMTSREIGLYLAHQNVDVKHFRLLYNMIKEKKSSYHQLMMARAHFILEKTFALKCQSIYENQNKNLVKRGGRIALSDSSKNDRCLQPASTWTQSLTHSVGKLSYSPSQNFNNFLNRRHRSDWARVTRSEIGGDVFSDSFILSMLRRIPEDEVQNSLNELLLLSCLSLSPDTAQASAQLGADPLSKYASNYHLEPKKAVNILGAILQKNPDNPLSHVYKSTPTPLNDELIFAATLCALSCVDLEHLNPLLTLTVPPHKTKMSNALELSFRLGLLQCINYFITLGMSLESANIKNLEAGFSHSNIGPVKKQALLELYAHEQKKTILKSIKKIEAPKSETDEIDLNKTIRKTPRI